VRWFPAEGKIISVPRMMGMNKKCVKNNEVDLWIFREDTITYRNRRIDNVTVKEKNKREFFRTMFFSQEIDKYVV